jgi:autotransporter-associated beta strand protein
VFGLGTVNLTTAGPNTYSGNTNITGATLVVNTVTALGNGNSTIHMTNLGAQEATLTFHASGVVSQPFVISGAILNVVSNDIVLSNVISGFGPFTLEGTTGSLTLTNGGNTYSGETVIFGGTLTAGVTNAFPESTQVQLANSAQALLNLAGFPTTIEGLFGGGMSGGNVTLGGAALTLLTDSLITNDYGGVISGGGSLIVGGSGLQTLSNVNTYGGSTTIESGTLQLGINNAIPAASPLSLTGPQAILDLNNFNLTINGVSGVSGSQITLENGVLTVGGASTSSTYFGSISGIGGQLIKTGTGTFTLGNDRSTYTGTTSITGGVLQAGADNVFSPGSLVDVSAGAALNLASLNEIIGGLIGAGDVTLGSGTLTITSTSSSPNDFAGAITGTNGSVIIAGTNTQIFSSSNMNTYSGSTTIQGSSTLQASMMNAFSPNSAVVLTGSNTVLDLQSNNNSIGSLSGVSGSSVSLGSGILTLVGSGNTTFSGTINGFGAGGLTLSETPGSMLTLSGVSAYIGSTTINTGNTLAAGAVNAFAPGSLYVLNGNAILTVGVYSQNIGSLSSASTVSTVNLGSSALALVNGSSSFAGMIIGAGNLTLNDSVMLTLSGTANTYLGTTTINNLASLIAGASGAFSPNNQVLINGSGLLNLVTFQETISTLTSASSNAQVNLDTGTLTLTGAIPTTYAGRIFDSGSGGIIFNESTTFTLTGTGLNTYSGPTILNSGTFAAGNNNVFSSSSSVTINNAAILALQNFPQTIGSLSSTSPNALVSLASGTLTLTGATSTDYQGAITGTGGLTLSEMMGTIFTLSGTGLNTYSGPTIIMNGNTLSAGNGNVFSPSSAVTLIGTSTLALNTYSQSINTLSSGSSTAHVTLGTSAPGGGTLTLTGTTSTTYAGAISGSGGITFNENATFLLTGSGLNSYSGSTILNSGILQAGAMNVFSPSSPVVMNGSATLDLQNFPQSISTLSGTSSSTLVSLGTTGTGILTLTGDGSSDYEGAITGAGGLTLSEAAGAVFTLSGSGLINYSGPTILNSGTLRAGAPDTLSMFSSVTIFGSATLDLNNFAASIGELSSASTTARVTLGAHVPGTGNLQLTGNVSSIYAGIITGTGGLTVAEATGTIFTLSGTSNTYSGTTRILEGTLQAGATGAFSPNSPVVIGSLLGGSAGILDLNDLSQQIPSLDSGETAAQVLLGMGTLTLTRDISTSYAGSITGTGGLTLLGRDTFRLDTTGLAIYSGVTSVDKGTLEAGRVNVFSPNSSVILLNRGVLDLNNHSETIPTLASSSFASKVLLGTATLTFTGTTSTTFDGAIFGTGGIVMDETATFTLRGSNLYEGKTVINSGTLSAGNNDTFSPLSPVEINNVGTLDLNGFFNSIDSLSSLSTGARVTLGSGTTGILTLVGKNDSAFTGIISGGGGLSKTGPSVFTLTNNNTYTGPTNIFAGEFVVDGALVSNQVNINGGTLKGPGPISSNVIIYSGGTDRPGGITTQQIIGSYKQNPGSKLVIELNSTTSALIDVTGVPGTATIEGSTLQVIALRDFHYSPVFNIYEIIRAPGQIIGKFGSTIFSRLMINPQVIYSPTDVIITFGLGLQTLSCITGNALRLLNYINENVANADVQSILFDLEPVLSDCPSFLAVLESLDPARYGTLSLSCLEMGLEFASALNNRVMINHSRRAEKSKGMPDIALLSMAKPDQIVPQGSIRKAAREEKNWDVWADGFDECLHGPTDSQNPAFNTNLYGVLLGAEKWLPHGMVGFGAGYADARVSEKHDLGIGKLRDYTAFLYGSAYWNNWYFDLGAFGSFLKIHSERNFLRPLVQTGAVSDHHAIQATLHFATGYDFPTTWGTFEPFGFADWVVQTENKFEETGSPYDMRLRSRKLSMLRSEAGLHYYQNWKSAWGMCIMKETFAYVNKAPFGVGEMEAAIIGVPGIFLQNSYTTVENLFHGGVQVFMTRSVEGNKTAPFFSLSYDVEVGSGYLSNAVQGMVGLYF